MLARYYNVTTYQYGEIGYGGGGGYSDSAHAGTGKGWDKMRAVVVNSIASGKSPDRLLDIKAEQVCKAEGINYKDLEPIQRLFLTHYRCPTCKLLPLYNLNIRYPKRVRCGRCGQLIAFKNAGKFGKLRKKIALLLSISFSSVDDGLGSKGGGGSGGGGSGSIP